MSGSMANANRHGAADTEVLITFEDISGGKCGRHEAEMAQKQAAQLIAESEPPESITRIQVDDSGYDMRVGTQLVSCCNAKDN